jgi:hypothetical protein
MGRPPSSVPQSALYFLLYEQLKAAAQAAQAAQAARRADGAAAEERGECRTVPLRGKSGAIVES